jgi:hypothetical protein
VADAVFSAAKKHSVKTSTILGIITVESTFDPSAVSSYGAVGLMQVVPRMHRDKLDAVKKQATNVKDNVDVGTQILQEFVILAKNDHIDACAQFMYKGYQVSLSTVGRSEGACPTPVAIFKSPDGDGYYESHVGDFNTVEDAIRYIDGDEVEAVRIVRPIIHEIAFLTRD